MAQLTYLILSKEMASSMPNKYNNCYTVGKYIVTFIIGN